MLLLRLHYVVDLLLHIVGMFVDGNLHRRLRITVLFAWISHRQVILSIHITRSYQNLQTIPQIVLSKSQESIFLKIPTRCSKIYEDLQIEHEQTKKWEQGNLRSES